jgi:cysteine desulfuration protein SufE
MSFPPKLQQILDTFALFPDQGDRTDLLLSFADKFTPVPPDVAARPYDKAHQVPACESDAYVWAVKNADGTVKLHFAVESPSGISAKALAAILDKGLSGLPPDQVATVTPDIVEQVFRQNISMGKGMGLMSMVNAVRTLAKRLE